MPVCFLAGMREKGTVYRHCGSRWEALGLVTDQVLGFREIEDSGAVRLDWPIINSRNGYLKAAALTKTKWKRMCWPIS